MNKRGLLSKAAILVVGLTSCSAGYDAQIKGATEHTGRAASDGEIVSACKRLRGNNWSYDHAAMSALSRASTTSQAASASRETAILAAITQVAGNDTQSYCESKLSD